jgi:hypothetical protein
LGASTSRNSKGLSRPVAGKLYLYLYLLPYIQETMMMMMMMMMIIMYPSPFNKKTSKNSTQTGSIC